MFEGQEKKNKSGRGANGQFLPENKFWRNVKKRHENRIYTSVDDFEEACLKYFDWVDDHPLYEMKAFGSGLIAKVPHPRAMTLHGLTAHIGISRRSWDEYRKRPEFKETCEMVEGVMFDQKFAGAAAGFFNAAIIARDLGLADKKEIDGNLTVEVVDSYETDDT